MATQAELAQALRDLKTEAAKAKDEITAKIASLEVAVVAAGNVTPEVEAALADLRAGVQAIDDIVPDAPTTP